VSRLSSARPSLKEQHVRETRRPPLRPGTVGGHPHTQRLVPDRVLVLDGYSNAALACVRSLGRAGYTVLVASHRRWPLAAASRSRPPAIPPPSKNAAPRPMPSGIPAS